MDDHGLFKDEIRELNATLVHRFPNPSVAVRLAFATLLGGQDSPIRAATVNAIIPGHPAAPVLGTALELMNTSLHTLHEGLDRVPRKHFSVSIAGDILAGDYLSSTAFRLLVEVNSLSVMGIVSEAIQKACENEILRLETAGEGLDLKAALSLGVSRRSVTLGGAAGATAAHLAGHNDTEVVSLAVDFGRTLAVAAYCGNQASVSECPEHTAVYRSLGLDALVEADAAAAAYAGRTGDHGPMMLIKRIQDDRIFERPR